MEEQTPAKSEPSGPTLLSLLVLVWIGALIAFFVFAPIFVRRSPHSHKTPSKALISVIGSALEAYRNDHDAYPPSPAAGTADDGTLFRYLNGVDGKGVTANPGTPNVKHFEPYLAITSDFVKHIGDRMIIIDPWGNPIHYFNCKAYVDAGHDPANCHNPDSFDLYSTGPDGKRDPNHQEPGTQLIDENKDGKFDDDAELVDDITNY